MKCFIGCKAATFHNGVCTLSKKVEIIEKSKYQLYLLDGDIKNVVPIEENYESKHFFVQLQLLKILFTQECVSKGIAILSAGQSLRAKVVSNIQECIKMCNLEFSKEYY